jgi:hypothetical protein
MLKFRGAKVNEIDEWMCHRLKEALQTLLAASNYASKSNASEESFAVSLQCLQQCGLHECDLHWLVSQSLTIHLIECTNQQDLSRIFRPGGLRIGPQSCFVLSDEGKAFANSVCSSSIDRLMVSKRSENSSFAVTPSWDDERRELHYRGHLIKRYRLPSPNQIAILSAFEEEKWPSKIDDPLVPSDDQDPKRRLHDTIRNLNRSHRLPLIKFVGDGTGQGVLWTSL